MDIESFEPALLFFPEHWGQVERFANLHTSTYTFDKLGERALHGVQSHFHKARILFGVAEKLKPNMALDNEELSRRGHTGAHNSAEFTAVFEASALELYSSLDCMRKVLQAVYGKTSRSFRDSTRRLFEKPHSIGGSFPDRLKDALAAAAWFRDFCALRDELTHWSSGSCRLSEEGVVSYMHVGMRKDGKPLIVEDVSGWLGTLFAEVNDLLGVVFHELNATLQARPIQLPCGVAKGRFLMREVNPAEQLTFNSGKCLSFTWFEQPQNPDCPFSTHCGAYLNAKAALAASR